ncbi:MAG TPA: hypothetical protein VMV93_03075 [Chloroflexota bacterium]|nr:hypothetical protein [Chloroflexota bacterium]
MPSFNWEDDPSLETPVRPRSRTALGCRTEFLALIATLVVLAVAIAVVIWLQRSGIVTCSRILPFVFGTC